MSETILRTALEQMLREFDADEFSSEGQMAVCHEARQALAALDSRAGDAGEDKAYRCRGCGWRGSEPIANGHPQNGCDLELMVHDPIATPAPAVDAQEEADRGKATSDAMVAVLASDFMRTLEPERVSNRQGHPHLLYTGQMMVDAFKAGRASNGRA